ncbi:hypothetical protein DBA20_08200 [Pandoraea capi]|uniref:hypothetical protein n=1 Tax=Pandoraea capi TaxID=2508286 RepID=UPI0012405C9C|nr:hypothetical protein [Pandoraea capi]MCI3204937.1 hypothetical protein [Pandoraea sp. LA3]MDN4582965.1 hypothetical protein [Pandoraea capi]
MRKRLVLVELNEINFDIAADYVREYPGRFPALAKLISGAGVRSTCEQNYEEIEPWIQWASVHSGKTYAEHGIFRLGDIVGSNVPQLFEQLERNGLRVGCVSAMNAENRLNAPAYFIPDPWTATPSDGSWWSRVLTEAVSQTVNDNAQARITFKSAMHLALGLLRFAQPKHYGLYAKLVATSKGASWRKALVLDLLLHDIHAKLFRANAPDFSTVFLNAGAHIQHHYFFNSRIVKGKTKIANPAWYVSGEVDPIAEMLEVYDRLVADYLSFENTEVIVATGLSQKPYDRVKYYYRLKDHASFMDKLGIRVKSIQPRMTRDFLLTFDSAEQAAAAQARLFSVTTVKDGTPIFGEIDNRGDSLFVTLTYPHEIDANLRVTLDAKEWPLAPEVAFVAIKNGMHQQTGFSYFSSGVAQYAPADQTHVKELYSTVLRFFERRTATTS